MRDEEELEAIESVRVIVDAQNSLSGGNVGKSRILAKTRSGVAFIVPIGDGDTTGALAPPKLPRRLQKLRSGQLTTEELEPKLKIVEDVEVKELADSAAHALVLKRSDWISNEVAKKLAFDQAEADRRRSELSQQGEACGGNISRTAKAIEVARTFELQQKGLNLKGNTKATEERIEIISGEGIVGQESGNGKEESTRQEVNAGLQAVTWKNIGINIGHFSEKYRANIGKS